MKDRKPRFSLLVFTWKRSTSEGQGHGVLFVQFSSVIQLCPTLCDPMDCSTASLSITKFELAHTHVHLVGDAIQPSHPLSSLSLPAFNLSQHEGSFPVSQFFASRGQSTGFSASASASASVLPMNIEDGFPLGWAD